MFYPADKEQQMYSQFSTGQRVAVLDPFGTKTIIGKATVIEIHNATVTLEKAGERADFSMSMIQALGEVR